MNLGDLLRVAPKEQTVAGPYFSIIKFSTTGLYSWSLWMPTLGGGRAVLAMGDGYPDLESTKTGIAGFVDAAVRAGNTKIELPDGVIDQTSTSGG